MFLTFTEVMKNEIKLINFLLIISYKSVKFTLSIVYFMDIIIDTLLVILLLIFKESYNSSSGYIVINLLNLGILDSSGAYDYYNEAYYFLVF